MNVLSGAPFGYRYVRKNEHADARYEMVAHEAAIVAELFARYVDDGVAIAALARWLSATGVPTRTGKTRWDRSVIWAMLRNPAYAGRACFGKTIRTDQPGLNRTARAGRTRHPTAYTVTDRPREDWLEIRVPALVDRGHLAASAATAGRQQALRRPQQQGPSLLQGLPPAPAADTPTTAGHDHHHRNKIYYYRCLGSDNYRYEHGRVCDNKPVRADYLDTIVWEHITGLLANPTLIRAEIDRGSTSCAPPTPPPSNATPRAGLAKATASINRLINAYQEQLISLDELRERMPDSHPRDQPAQPARGSPHPTRRPRGLPQARQRPRGLPRPAREQAAAATVAEQQRVLRLLVKDVLIGPDRIIHPPQHPHRPPPPPPESTDRDTDEEGTSQVANCVGGVLSPLLANVALCVLDEHFAKAWRANSGNTYQRTKRRRAGLANYRIVRYADDFVVLVSGTQAHAETVREDVAAVLAPMGLRLSEAKTKICHIDEGFDFLGFRIQRRRKRGTTKRAVYTYPSKKALASIVGRVRTLTLRIDIRPLRPCCASSTRSSGAGAPTPPRRVEGDLRLPRPVHLAPGGPVDPETTQQDEVGRPLPPLPSRLAAGRGWRGAVPTPNGDGQPLPLPGREHSHALADKIIRNSRLAQRHGRVESRMRGDAHVRFGGRDEET